MNTLMQYLYRDASNYKMPNEVIIKGEMTPGQMNTVKSCCDSGEYFIPSRVGLPEVRFPDVNEDDTDFFELQGFYPIEKEPTVNVTAAELVQAFCARKGKWFLPEPMCPLPSLNPCLVDVSDKDESQKAERDNYLAGDYIFLPTYATLSDEEHNALGDGERPVVYIAVQKRYLLDWIDGSAFKNLEDFLNNFTYEDTEGMEADARLNHALAFTYCPSQDDTFEFPDVCDGDAMLALMDFISTKLQDNGFEGASKFLDCLFGF